MPFLRPLEYFVNRFSEKQEEAWLAYKAGLDPTLNWGRRSGKSELIGEIFVEDIEDFGKDCMYLALTQGQAREIMWPKFEQTVRDYPAWKSNASRLEFQHVPTKAIISLKGADIGKDKLRGGAKRIIACDEKAFWRDATIEKDVLRPQLADYNGILIKTSTPKGKNHFWEDCEKAKKDPSRYFYSHATIFDNPFIPAAGRDKVIAEYGGETDPLYRQEILAEFVTLSGLVFALDQDTYTERRWDLAEYDHAWHWRGVDHGFSPDPTACLWMAYSPRKGYFQVYSEYKQKQLLIHKHAEIINAQWNYHFVDTISDVDPQVVAEYEAVGLPMSSAAKFDKESRFLRLVNALKQGRLKITHDCVELLKEMATLEWDFEQEDHLCDALNYVFTNATVPEMPHPKAPVDPFEERRKNSHTFYHSQNFGDED